MHCTLTGATNNLNLQLILERFLGLGSFFVIESQATDTHLGGVEFALPV